jgi:molecular chaperone GrpE
MTNKTRAQERIDEVDISPTALLADAEAARKEAAEAKAKADEYLGALQRERAEFLNFKRRTSEERERDLGLAADALISKVLQLADDFDRAIEAMPANLREDAWSGGVAAIDRKLRALLESEGVRPIESLGRQFDPREHEAVVSVPGTGRPPGEVVAEVQRGYRIRDRVLRPSLVGVATDGADDGAADNEDTTQRND